MKLIIEDILSITRVALRNVGSLNPQSKIRISTDSRTIQRGDVFFAIHGEKFNGHKFVGKAFDNGAVLAVVDGRSTIEAFGARPIIVVSDTTKALGELALRYRKKFSIPLIAIAGSNGKTITRDMIAGVLSGKFLVLKTEGNLNNQIGVPQTIFRLERKHEIAVIELGTNHFGELAYLCDIVQPTHGLITNIGHEHLEFFRDLHGVAKEEGALFDVLAKPGTGFINADDPWIVRKAKKLKRKITYGFAKKPVHVQGKFLGIDDKVRATISVKSRGKKEFAIRLPVPGKHLISNALAATTVGMTFNVPAVTIKRSLEGFTPSSKRMEVEKIHGVTILNDTYNANPDSMQAALETLKAMQSKGKKIAVLADMLELGAYAEDEHRKVGASVNDAADYLLTYGPSAHFMYEESRMNMKFHYDQKNVLSEYLVELISPGDVVLVKGSRGMKMEDVVTFLLERLKSARKVVSLAS